MNWIELKYSTIGSDSGLALARWQAIIWTNDDLFADKCMRHSASMGWFYENIPLTNSVKFTCTIVLINVFQEWNGAYT